MKILRSMDAVQRDIKRVLERSINSILDEAINIARQRTPVRTGRARRGWKRREKFSTGRQRQTVIENLVPYIGILDRRVKIMKPALDRAVYITRRIR